MIEAAAKFEGTHNFESFRAAACQSNQPVRHVRHCRLIQHGPYLILDIQADGFLHHMVRNIIGCLLEIGQGMYGVDHIDHILQQKIVKQPVLPHHRTVCILSRLNIQSILTYPKYLWVHTG